MYLVHLTLGRLNELFPFPLANKTCFGVFPEAFCLLGQPIQAEIFQLKEVTARCSEIF